MEKSAQSVSGMGTQAKTNPNVTMNLLKLGYAEADIPAYFKRPTAEEQAAFNASQAQATVPEAPPPQCARA